MNQPNQLEETFELHCSRCLETAINEYLRRANIEQLDRLLYEVERTMSNIDTDEALDSDSARIKLLDKA